MGDTIGDQTNLSELLKSQNKVAYVNVGTYEKPTEIKLTPAVKKQYGLDGDVMQRKNSNKYYISIKGGRIMDVTYKEDNGAISKQDAQSATGVDENIFNSLAFELKTLAAEGEVAVGLKFTDQDKLSILDYVEQSASQAGDKILNATTFDLQAENIGVDKSGIIQDLETIKEGETVVFAFQYPDKNDLNALKTTIYNVDDGIVIPPEGIEKIKGAVQDAINSVTANGFKINGFGRYAGSTTSRVGTAYGKEDNGTTEENNVTLATDRCGAMNAQVDIIVESLLPGIIIETTENIVKPNQGPGWYSDKGLNTPVPIGDTSYTINQLSKMTSFYNLAGYQITKYMCLTCAYSPTLLGSYSKYNYIPTQNFFLDKSMIGDTASIFINVLFNSDAGKSELREKEMKVIFE
jgi:hypothetical protein